MKLFNILTTTALTAASVVSAASRLGDKVAPSSRVERFLSGSGDSGSGDNISYDDDFWAYNANVDITRGKIWTNYHFKPLKCIVYNHRHVIAYELYKPNNKQCQKKRQGTYIMEVGQFARAYVAQKEQDYEIYYKKDYGKVESLDYTTCTEVYYNDNPYYTKLGCSNTGGLKLISYSDSSCSTEISTNLGIYNDIKIQFNTCSTCLTWPAATDDDGEEDEQQDDNFDYYHQYDSKMCGAANHYQKKCGWNCRRHVNKKSSSGGSYSSSAKSSQSHYWNGFEKFFLFFWSFCAVGLTWIVLKQRRHMSRDDAIVEEAAMQGVGLKKRHIFPIALGVIFFTIFSMFMVWKKLAWLFLIGVNFGLFAHFMYLRRKAKRAGMAGYVKDGGLEIS